MQATAVQFHSQLPKIQKKEKKTPYFHIYPLKLCKFVQGFVQRIPSPTE